MSTGPMKILLAVDGSEHARAAACFVRDLPAPPDSEVTALAVLTPRHTPGRAALTAALAEARELLEPAFGPAVHTGFLHGHPAEQLAEYASEHGCDLMALGAKGLRTTLGILLGGVAQQVVEYAHWPVLVVRAPYAGLRRVLLLVDGSAYSQRALAYFARFPLPEDLEITLLHVLPPQADVMLEPPVDPRRVGARPAVDVDPSVARSAAAEERAGQQLLARAAAALQATGVAAQQQLLQGDAATEIIRYARNDLADLLVAGSRGLSAVRGWLLGSVSRKLLHYTDRSVLIVRSAEPGA